MCLITRRPHDRAMNDAAFLLQFTAALALVVTPIVALVRLIAGSDDPLAEWHGAYAAR